MLIASYCGSIASAAEVETSPPAPEQANCFVESSSDTVEVSSMSALASALAAAPPGRNILIAPGTYAGGGALDFAGNGAEGNPIVIRPRDGLGTVTINSPRFQFGDTSSWIVMEKLYFAASRIVLRGDHNRIARCRFRNINVNSPIVTEQARDCRIDHCDFSDWQYDGAQGGCIAVRPEHFPNGAAARLLIDHCYFHDMTPDAGQNGNEIIQLFANTNHSGLEAPTLTVDRCLFSNINIPGEGEIVSIKLGGVAVRGCTFVNCPGMYLPMRTSANCEIRSCWFEGPLRSDPLMVRGPNNLVIGNRFIGGLNLGVWAGNASWADILSGAAGIGSYAPATESRIIGNRLGSGHILVGTYWGSDTNPGVSLPADSNLLEENTRDSGGSAGSLISSIHGFSPAQTNTTVNSTTSAPYTPAVKLTSNNVGLEAPDPLCV